MGLWSFKMDCGEAVNYPVVWRINTEIIMNEYKCHNTLAQFSSGGVGIMWCFLCVKVQLFSKSSYSDFILLTLLEIGLQAVLIGTKLVTTSYVSVHG